MGWHRHERSCVTCVTAGELLEEFPDHGVACAKGMVLTKPSGQSHRVFFPDDTLYLHVELQPELDQLLGKPFSEPVVQDDPFVSLLLAQIGLELRRQKPSRIVLYGLAYQIVGETARQDLNEGMPDWLSQARRFVEKHLDSVLSVNEVAAEVNRHPAHVSRAFRRFLGCSILAYQRSLRLRKAEHLLRTSDESIAGIAALLGFFDQSHFTRVFQKEFGVSPSYYRRSRR